MATGGAANGRMRLTNPWRQAIGKMPRRRVIAVTPLPAAAGYFFFFLRAFFMILFSFLRYFFWLLMYFESLKAT